MQTAIQLILLIYGIVIASACTNATDLQSQSLLNEIHNLQTQVQQLDERIRNNREYLSRVRTHSKLSQPERLRRIKNLKENMLALEQTIKEKQALLEIKKQKWIDQND